jgi:hypothetical protein
MSAYVGVNLDIAPSIVMIDIDRQTFKTQRAFGMALTRTIRKILGTIVSKPTVVWSGGGYHVYLVLHAFVLEGEDAFNNSKFGSNPSQKFLRFAEWFLSNGKCDPQHNKTVSLRNSMLRIPGSVNSKNGQTVTVIKKWNGYRPNIKLLLEDFYVYLCNQRVRELHERAHKLHSNRIHKMGRQDNCVNVGWIENLLRTPLKDFRKLVIWRILAPYLLNIRGLPLDEAHRIIWDWLGICNQLKRLDFNPNYRIRSVLNSSKVFLPISRVKLKVEHEGLYSLLHDRGVFCDDDVRR